MVFQTHRREGYVTEASLKHFTRIYTSPGRDVGGHVTSAQIAIAILLLFCENNVVMIKIRNQAKSYILDL